MFVKENLLVDCDKSFFTENNFEIRDINDSLQVVFVHTDNDKKGLMRPLQHYVFTMEGNPAYKIISYESKRSEEYSFLEGDMLILVEYAEIGFQTSAKLFFCSTMMDRQTMRVVVSECMDEDDRIATFMVKLHNRGESMQPRIYENIMNETPPVSPSNDKVDGRDGMISRIEYLRNLPYMDASLNSDKHFLCFSNLANKGYAGTMSHLCMTTKYELSCQDEVDGEFYDMTPNSSGKVIHARRRGTFGMYMILTIDKLFKDTAGKVWASLDVLHRFPEDADIIAAKYPALASTDIAGRRSLNINICDNGYCDGFCFPKGTLGDKLIKLRIDVDGKVPAVSRDMFDFFYYRTISTVFGVELKYATIDLEGWLHNRNNPLFALAIKRYKGRDYIARYNMVSVDRCGVDVVATFELQAFDRMCDITKSTNDNNFHSHVWWGYHLFKARDGWTPGEISEDTFIKLCAMCENVLSC